MSDFCLTTVNDVLALATSRGAQTVMLAQVGTEWSPITSDELRGRVRALAEALSGWGIGKGDRVAILSENRWEWAVTDLAVLALGAVDVPLYSTLNAEQLGYSLTDSGAKVLVVSSREQYDKLAEAGELPALEHVAVMDDGEYPGAESFAKLLTGASEKQGPDPTFDERVKAVRPEDLATIIYTSGTTGQPKGVMLTHGNLASNINEAIPAFGLAEEDRVISYLPLSHVFERHVDYAILACGAKLAYCAKFDQLPVAMKAVKPTFFVGVPRVYEKVRQGVEGKSAHSPVKKRILKWALATGKKQRQETLAGKSPSGLTWKLADKLVYSKIREAFGGCVKASVSGSAPLGMDTVSWFADVGMVIYEGYGLTETSPVVSFNNPQGNKMNTIGKALRNVEVRFAPDGEIEVRGPSIFSGYWNKEKETQEAFSEDGWFKTGDIGKIDEDGFLSITDRKKELLKTSGGKIIAPQPIENKLKANTLVAQAAMVGDKHKFACVLISPNLQALEKWAQSRGVTTSDHSKLVKDPKVCAEYKRIVDEANKTLGHHETMKRVCVVPDEWSIETGELTPSMKMKRRVIEEKYKAEIEQFYKDEASAKAE